MGGLAVTSIIAGGATALYAVWHFQRMSPLGLLANLAAMPIVSLIVMPFAVLGALAMPFGARRAVLRCHGQGADGDDRHSRAGSRSARRSMPSG